MKSIQLAKYVAAFLIGVAVGAACLVTAFYHIHKNSKVFIARTTIYTDNGIVIPKGTKMIYEHGLPEGIECLKINLNMTPSFMESSFDVRTEQKSFLVIPYWVDAARSK